MEGNGPAEMSVCVKRAAGWCVCAVYEEVLSFARGVFGIVEEVECYEDYASFIG